MDNVTTVLIVDDELAIRRFLRASLPEHEFRTFEAESAADAVRLTATHNPDLILLDLGLPDGDGIDVTKRIREWSQIPIIVLSARSDESDKVLALDCGANDYLTKPFGVAELLARIRVALRISKRTDEGSSSFQTGELKVDFATRQVFLRGKEVHLTPLEYKLLSTLVRHAGKVLTHKDLLTQVWGAAYAKENHYLRVFMGQLRHKIEEEPAKPKFLTTEPGVGYRFRTEE